MKEPRARDGKVRKHHWFKSGGVLLRLSIDQKRAEAEASAKSSAKKPRMYASVAELFEAAHEEFKR